MEKQTKDRIEPQHFFKGTVLLDKCSNLLLIGFWEWRSPTNCSTFKVTTGGVGIFSWWRDSYCQGCCPRNENSLCFVSIKSEVHKLPPRLFKKFIAMSFCSHINLSLSGVNVTENYFFLFFFPEIIMMHGLWKWHLAYKRPYFWYLWFLELVWQRKVLSQHNLVSIHLLATHQCHHGNQALELCRML